MSARGLGAQEHGGSSRWALVVEPDLNDLEFVSEVLRAAGFSVMGARSAERARDLICSRTVDLCLLNLGLEDVNGIELLVDVRKRYQMPVIVLTDRSDTETEVVCLRLGADEFLVKPFPPALFAARLSALLRRSGNDRDDQILQFDGLRIDLSAREVTLGGDEVVLPAREFDVLAFLARHPRQVLSRRQLLDQVWESAPELQGEATVTEHIRKLRLRIEPASSRHRWISTVRSVGYRFNP